MLCREFEDRLVEGARHEVEPGRVLRAHMQTCRSCRDRWEAEEGLTSSVKTLRAAAWDQRSSAASREMLMRKFAAQKRAIPMTRSRFENWSWALAAAAALVISIFAVPDIERRLKLPVSPAASNATEFVGTDTEAEIPGDGQADTEADGFIAVPFVPPLATGEMVRVVHTELNPAALASLGVSVDPAWTTQLPADVLLGEDGMPRAVRVSDATSGNGGF
jgi:hypothetical protein